MSVESARQDVQVSFGKGLARIFNINDSLPAGYVWSRASSAPVSCAVSWNGAWCQRLSDGAPHYVDYRNPELPPVQSKEASETGFFSSFKFW